MHVLICVSLISSSKHSLVFYLEYFHKTLESYGVEMQFAIATQYTMNLTIFIEIFNNGKEIIADMKK